VKDRETAAKGLGLTANLIEDRWILSMPKDPIDQADDLFHLGFLHPAG
jgi:hypothetical protein